MHEGKQCLSANFQYYVHDGAKAEDFFSPEASTNCLILHIVLI